jgi:hypothetical protein
VSGNNNGVFNIIEFNSLVNNIANRTLSTGPGLDSYTILTVVTDTVENSNSFNIFGLTTFTKGTNTETVTTVTGDMF